MTGHFRPCELNGANPFDYLTALQKHAAELSTNPSQWMPWNYRQILQRADAELDAGQPTPGV